MPWPNDEIKKIGTKLGDYIEWHEAVRMAIRDVVPDPANSSAEGENN